MVPQATGQYIYCQFSILVHLLWYSNLKQKETAKLLQLMGREEVTLIVPDHKGLLLTR